MKNRVWMALCGVMTGVCAVSVSLLAQQPATTTTNGTGRTSGAGTTGLSGTTGATPNVTNLLGSANPLGATNQSNQMRFPKVVPSTATMKPSGEADPSIEQLLNHYEAVKDQITALEHRKKELSEQIKKKLAGQAELLKKLGLADEPVVDVPAPGAPPK